MKQWMQQTLARWALAGAGLCAAATPAWAQSEASAALSLMPVASVVASTGAAAAGASAVLALPAALSVGGAALVVVAVQASAASTVYLFERISDGARASVEVSARTGRAVAHGVGTAVECSVIGAGVVLSVAGEVLAFVPNALGRALLHNERL